MTAFNSKEYGSSFINWNISELLLCICCAVKHPVFQLTAGFIFFNDKNDCASDFRPEPELAMKVFL